jgi:hypothetical protein
MQLLADKKIIIKLIGRVRRGETNKGFIEYNDSMKPLRCVYPLGITSSYRAF